MRSHSIPKEFHKRGRRRRAIGRLRRRSGLIVECLEGRALPSFVAAPRYAVGYSPSDAPGGGVNGDSAPDLVTANASLGTMSVLLANGNGTFQAALTSPTAWGSSPRV